MLPEVLPDQSVHPEATAAPFKLRGGWRWEDPRDGEHFRRCGFCGSIHPEDLAAEPMWTAEWADRKYGYPHKFYVEVPNREPDALYVISASHDDHDGTYVPEEQLTDAQRAIAERDGWLREGDPWTHFQFSTRPNHHGKFYTVHLRDSGVSAEAKLVIERRSGIAFEFKGTQLRWWPWGAAPTE